MTESEFEYLKGRIDSLQLLAILLVANQPGFITEYDSVIEGVLGQIATQAGAFEDKSDRYREGARESLKKLSATLENLRTKQAVS